MVLKFILKDKIDKHVEEDNNEDISNEVASNEIEKPVEIVSELQIPSDVISDDPYDYVAGSVDYPNYQPENN